MSECSNCGKETELYHHGVPVCVDCSASGLIPEHILPERNPDNSSDVPPQETPSD